MGDDQLRALERAHEADPTDGAVRNALGRARDRIGLCGWCGKAPGARVLDVKCAGSGARVCDPCGAASIYDDRELGRKVRSAVTEAWTGARAGGHGTWVERMTPLVVATLDVTKGWPLKQRNRALRLVNPDNVTSHGRKSWRRAVRLATGELPSSAYDAALRNRAKRDPTAPLFPEVSRAQ